MSYATCHLKKGEKTPCMRCTREVVLDFEPVKCCSSKQESINTMCGCQGAPEPIFCTECWKELTG